MCIGEQRGETSWPDVEFTSYLSAFNSLKRQAIGLKVSICAVKDCLSPVFRT